MRPMLSLAALCLSGLPLSALAEVPAVVADTAPVHSLTAMVMGDLGAPALLLPPGMSPHDASLRPSDAQGLAAADVVIWTGPELVPAIEGPIAALAGGASVLALLETDGWDRLPRRTDPDFATADHDHDHDHAHEAEADHAEEDGHDHDHGAATDPHAWLDPAVASVWLGHIAGALSAADPDNAATYAANAEAAAAALMAQRARLATDLAPLAGRAYVVPHDAYQYFETAFGLPAAGAIALSDAADPGPAHVAALQARIADEGILCILTDPQTNPGLVALVAEGSGARTAAADPDGTSLEPGAGLYPALIDGVAGALLACLSD